MNIHRLSGYIQSIYLVEYPHGLMLLDGCSRADMSLIKSFITETLRRPMSDLKVVIVTHMHPDHAGAAAALRRVSGCRVITADKPHHWYRGINGMLMYVTDILLTFWVAGRLRKPKRNLLYWPFLNADITLNDNDPVPGFEQWRVLEMPGHTDRDLAVWHHDSNRVYVADLVVKVKGRYIPPFPVFHPNRYRRSVTRLHDMKPASIMLAHGGEVTLADEEYQYLFHQLPDMPKTHWRATRKKIRQLIRRYRLRGNS